MSVSETHAPTDEITNIVLGMWRALSARDWDALKSFLAPECIYVDMPLGPTLAARGPEDIVKRLKVGIEPLAAYENFHGLMLSNGVDVTYEHCETWTFGTGQTGTLPFVSVHRVENGKMTLWKDYWDMGGLTGFAPPSWLESLADSDMSWIYDASNDV